MNVVIIILESIHKYVKYTDNALRKFFEKAEKEDWYNNTLFVITTDHTNASQHNEYLTDAGLFIVPIIFICPIARLMAVEIEYTTN